MIAHETGVANTIDPLGGSYFVEELTNRLEAEAYDYFDADRRSSAAWSPRSRRTSSSARSPTASFRYQSEVERGERVIVGVNRYELEDEQPLEILRIDPALEQQQIERVQALRGRRDSAGGRGGARRAEAGRRRGDAT